MKLKSESVFDFNLDYSNYVSTVSPRGPGSPRRPEAARGRRLCRPLHGTARKELFGPPVRISDELKRIVDPEGVGNEMTRTDVNKNLWAYIKANDLQHPDDRRTIRNDEAMRTVFDCETMSMFAMNKLVQGHLEKVEK